MSVKPRQQAHPPTTSDKTPYTYVSLMKSSTLWQKRWRTDKRDPIRNRANSNNLLPQQGPTGAQHTRTTLSLLHTTQLSTLWAGH